MQVNVHVDAETTSVQFVALANFFTELSGVPNFKQALPPADPANLDEPEVVVIPETTTATTKRRRTKAEIAADEAAAKVAAAEAKAQEDAISGEGSAVAQGEAAAQASNEAAPAEIKAAEAATVVVDDFEKVAAVTGSKTYTEAEAQQLATVIARTKGPQVVKDKIAELGATRIGDLNADQLNQLGNFLEAQK